MALNANALIDTDEAAESLGEKSTSATFELERRINALSETFEGLTGYILTEQALTGFRANGSNGSSGVSYSGIGSFGTYGFGGSGTSHGRTHILIPIIPVQSVTKIEIRHERDDSIAKTITDTTKFLLKGKDLYGHSRTGRLQLFEDVYLAGNDNILLDMTVGFASTHPKRAEAQRLLLVQLKYEFRRYQNDEEGLISRTFADGSVSFASPNNILKEVMDGLMGIKSWRFTY